MPPFPFGLFDIKDDAYIYQRKGSEKGRDNDMKMFYGWSLRDHVIHFFWTMLFIGTI